MNDNDIINAFVKFVYGVDGCLNGRGKIIGSHDDFL
jgi:hypothetical protein